MTDTFKKLIECHNEIDLSQLSDNELKEYRDMGFNMVLESDEQRMINQRNRKS